MNRELVLFFILTVLVGDKCSKSETVTQTVYGFLDFTTTIGNTVMVFSPQSAPTIDLGGHMDNQFSTIETKPNENLKIEAENVINPSSTIANKNSRKLTLNISEVILDRTLSEPEYDLLSRQPEEYAEENFKLVNLKPSTRNSKPKHSTVYRNKHKNEETDKLNRPEGLVTQLRDTELKNGLTTIHETNVIGTFISGKYAQILQSSSEVYNKKKSRIQPTPPLRILKTATPTISKSHSALTSSRNKNRHVSSSHRNTIISAEPSIVSAVTRNQRPKSKRKHKNSRGSTVTPTHASESFSRRSFKPNVHPSTTEPNGSSSFYTFKLNRTPGRWQYKTSPKPRIAIRKLSSDNETINSTSSLISITTLTDTKANSLINQFDLESSGSQNEANLNNIENDKNVKLFEETLNVEISTPADFKDTYYEIATIKTPFIFQAGVLKKTRYITVTSTIEKTLTSEITTPIHDGLPLTENILAIPATDQPNLEKSIKTLATLHLTLGETPKLETVTETYTTSQIQIKTKILPIIWEQLNSTSQLTLMQTYDYTSYLTVTRTISSYDESEFAQSKNFKDFSGILDEAGSEINLELEYGDEDNRELNDERQSYEKSSSNDQPINKYETKEEKNDMFLNQKINSDKQQLALLNIFNPTPAFSTVITTSHPVVKHETKWETYVVPVINGQSTVFRTLSKSIGTVDKTEFKIELSTLAIPPPPLSVNPYLLPIQQFHTITSSYIHPTVITQTNSKVLKLTFGAKTAYTTILSTEVVPTSLTMFLTTSLPVQPTGALPGYYPQPFAAGFPFPFVG